MSDAIAPCDDSSAGSDLYDQAQEAFRRRELEDAANFAQQAASQYEVARRDDVGKVYNLLGGITYWQGDLDSADNWYHKAIESYRHTGDVRKVARSYHYLSFVARARADFESATIYLWRSIRINEKLGNERAASDNYHQLGLVAYHQDDLDSAEKWYRKSLEIDARSGDELGVAKTYNNLSAVYNDRKKFDEAEDLLRQSIAIKERLGDERGVARCYHQMGVVANHRGDFKAADNWYSKALEIDERLKDEVSRAQTYFNLSSNARDKNDTDAAAEWLRKTLGIFESNNDAPRATEAGYIAEQAEELDVAQLLYQSAIEISRKTGNFRQEAFASRHMGNLMGRQGDYMAARQWYERALDAHQREGDTDGAAKCCLSLGNLSLGRSANLRPDIEAARKWFRKSLELEPSTSWWQKMVLQFRLWRYQVRAVFLK